MNQSLFRRRATDERGAAMFLIIITILIVMLAGAFALDLSATSKRGQDLQNSADSAALAGVQAYRASMAEREDGSGAEVTPTAADEAKARQAVEDMLAQNGVTGVTADVTFPDGLNNAEVSVSITDNDGGGKLLSGFTGIGGTVERNATARFERCQSACVKDVAIPPPFRDINTNGDGDGYKPIPVGDRLFSINHNSGLQSDGNTRGNRQITCVDRFTGEQCWDTPGRPAYSGIGIGDWVPDATPEMLHGAVYDDMIYWVSSTQAGTYLFCFNAAGSRDPVTGVFNGVDTPCSVPYRLNENARGDLSQVQGSRVQHRGGGAFVWNGQIFAFTDDHRIHCVEPGLPLTPCETYGAAGLATQLDTILRFPANDPFDGNDGSSIDRIIDTDAARVYATLHITNLAATNAVSCATPLANPVGDTVVIKNTGTNTFLKANSPRSGTTRFMSDDGNHITARWYVVDAGDGTVYLRNASTNRHVTSYSGGAHWLDSFQRLKGVDSDLHRRERWDLFPAGGNAFNIERAFTYDNPETTVIEGRRAVPSDDFERLITWSGRAAEANEAWSSTAEDEWEFYPYECANPDHSQVAQLPALDASGQSRYKVGTYLHCWDLISAASCGGFDPQRIHDDPDSFSGRLFFYRSERTPGLWDEEIDGICSTGFNERWRWMNMVDFTELKCFSDESGVLAPTLAASMTAFENALKATNDNSHGWGTWGDPHWNQHTNRLFYPTNRADSRVLCWDFDDTFCGQVQGQSSLGYIQDYGFYSEGNCIFGLGHNAFWWAFSASDIESDCTGSGRTTTITPCACAGKLTWGKMKFEISAGLFESFLVVLRNEEGEQVFPPLSEIESDPPTPPHSVLAEGGEEIDLDFLEVEDIHDELTVQVIVEAKVNADPWAQGTQSFKIELERTPRLTD